MFDHLNYKELKLLREANPGRPLIEIMSEVVMEVLENEHRPFHLVGISMGGLMSQFIASQWPQKIHSLHLLCTVTGGYGNAHFLTDYVKEAWSELPGPGQDPLYHALEPCVTEACVDKPYFHEIMEHLRNIPVPVTGSTLMVQWTALRDYSSLEYLRDIKLPTFVYWGAGDRVVCRKELDKLMEHLPGASLTEYPSGHLFFMEFVQQFCLDLRHNALGNQFAC